MDPQELPSPVPLLSANGRPDFRKFPHLNSMETCLNLHRCCTLAAVYHPEVLQLPFIPHCQEHAKLSMVSALEFTSDPATKECLILLTDPEFLKWIDIPRDTCTILDSAQRSISSTTKTTIKQKARVILHKRQADFWNSTLTPLLVQSKVKDIILPEPQSCTWNRLQPGLPAGQLSFLIRAGADCLPTPLNLRRWHFRVCSKRHSLSPTSAHILNSCEEALTQGRYTWRHNSVLNCILSSIREELSKTIQLYRYSYSYMESLWPQFLLTSALLVRDLTSS